MKRKRGKNEFEQIKDFISPILSKGDSRIRGKVGEYLSGIEFLKNKWEVYEPIQDAYVDFILKSGNKFRTIQVKTSKLTVDKQFKVNHKPKDILPFLTCFETKGLIMPLFLAIFLIHLSERTVIFFFFL